MGHLGPKRGQNEVFGHFWAQNALVFPDFVYYDWKLWYLVASSGQSAGKNFVGPKMGSIRAKKGSKWGHYLVQNALDFADFAYYDQE